MSIEKVTQERLDIAQQLKNELEDMKSIQKDSGDLLSKQLGLYKDAAVINDDLLAKESLKRNVSNDFAKQQLKTIQGQNIIRKNVAAQTFCGIDQASSKFVFNLARAQLVTGATTSQLSDLLAIQESVTSSSRETLLAQLSTVSAAIRLEGVAPDAVFRQLAENAEAVALSINDGGDNLIKAAIQARKLGVEFRTVTGIADKLLDFESSIESQLQASVLLGREINLDRARQLALNNDLAGALEEVVTQVGGEAEFNELNRIQRQALADSVGVSVQELSRLVRDNGNAGIEGVASSFTDVEKYQNESINLLNQVVRNTDKSAKANTTTANEVGGG